VRGRPRSNVAQLCEIAIGEVKARNGAAEALIIRLVEIKARLDGDVAERSAEAGIEASLPRWMREEWEKL
jgi:hypothetical protein